MYILPPYAQSMACYNVKFCTESISLKLGWPEFILTEQMSVTIVTDYWNTGQIFKTISEVIGRNINPGTLVVLFSIFPIHGLSKSSQHTIALSSLLARRLILLKWTHASPPTHNKWIYEMLQCIALERIRSPWGRTLCTFYEMWQPFVNYVDSLTIDVIVRELLMMIKCLTEHCTSTPLFSFLFFFLLLFSFPPSPLPWVPTYVFPPLQLFFLLPLLCLLLLLCVPWCAWVWMCCLQCVPCLNGVGGN